MAGNQGDSQPSAYLNYILFDKDYKFLDMGWEPVPSSADFTKQKISIPTVNVREPGYIFVYLSYEGESNNWVYFDDFQVTHTPTNVIQYNEYYPFGLQTSTSWTRENHRNDYLYNEGSELNPNSGWYETFFRGYDPALGRFLQVDPLASVIPNYSPYAYANNNPVLLNDPWGLLAAEVFWDLVDDLLNSDYGGSWSEDGGKQYYNSNREAFNAGADYNDQHDSWGYTYYGSAGATKEVFNNMQKNGNTYLPSPVHYKYKYKWTKNGPEYVGLGSAQQGGPDPDPWYVQAWNAYWNKFHETAVVFNMDDDPNAEGWNSAPMRGLVPDNITLEFNVGASSIVGGNATYTINLITRGQKPGLYFTKTFQNSMGVEYGYGASLGFYHFSPSLSELKGSTLLGRTDTYTGGFGAGGSISLGYDNNKVIWSGVSAGVGATLGASRSTGTTYTWNLFGR